MLAKLCSRRFSTSASKCLDFTFIGILPSTYGNLHIPKFGNHELNGLYPNRSYNCTQLVLWNHLVTHDVICAQNQEDLNCSPKDDIRREQLNRIIGKIGIKKRDAGTYWKQYKEKRIKIRKRKRVI